MLLASAYDQSRFFKAADLDKDLKLRIKGTTEELVGNGLKQEMKLVVWFTNAKKGLVLNKTNNRTIRGAYGDPVEGWEGKLIIIFPTETEMGGKIVPCVRVRIPPPAGQAPSRPANVPPAPKTPPTDAGDDDPDDEIPF
jgi:hypothetical protein